MADSQGTMSVEKVADKENPQPGEGQVDSGAATKEGGSIGGYSVFNVLEILE